MNPKILDVVEWFFFAYFILVNLGYILLSLISLWSLRRYRQAQGMDGLPPVYSGFELPISILVPAYNEANSVVESIHSLFQLTYPEFEIVVVNDGSSDSTLANLIRAFKMLEFPESLQGTFPCQKIRGVYRSSTYPNLRVVDKENGGKADALNAGLNVSYHPLFCCVDSDSILQRNSLQQVVKPFLDDPTTVASGGTVRILNGCRVHQGYLIETKLPSSPLAIFQIIEYLRAFLFGRMGWSTLNALLVISGAFGLFRKDVVVEIGGYRADTVGEDMELVVRIQRWLRQSKKKGRVHYVPDPICWTEAPEDFRTLRRQRVRWQRGLAESLWGNIGLLFYYRGGWASWVAFPWMLFFEWLGPLIEVSGYVFAIVAFCLGWISWSTFIAFFCIAVGMGVLLSTASLLLEEMSFHVYPRVRDVFRLFFAAIFENFGYRQLNACYRLIGFFSWMFGRKGRWGEMKRNLSWQG